MEIKAKNLYDCLFPYRKNKNPTNRWTSAYAFLVEKYRFLYIFLKKLKIYSGNLL